MNVFKDIWTDMVEKRLWFPAAILILAIAGVPFVLGNPGDPAPAAIEQPTGVAQDEGPQLALTRASTTGFARPPRVNDDRLDPFASRAKANKAATDELNKTIDSILGGGDAGGGAGGGGGGGGNSPDPTPNTPEPDTDPEVETESDDLLSILVTNVSAPAEEPLQVSDIRTLSPLVDPADPFLVYVGKTSDESATFLVSSDVTVSGDGSCSPSPADCRTLILGIGQTAEFTKVTDQSVKTAITVLDIETKDVPINAEGSDTTAASADDVAAAEQLKRAGAKALKSVLADDEVIKTLVKHKVKIRK